MPLSIAKAKMTSRITKARVTRLAFLQKLPPESQAEINEIMKENIAKKRPKIADSFNQINVRKNAIRNLSKFRQVHAAGKNSSAAAKAITDILDSLKARGGPKALGMFSDNEKDLYFSEKLIKNSLKELGYGGLLQKYGLKKALMQYFAESEKAAGNERQR